MGPMGGNFNPFNNLGGRSSYPDVSSYRKPGMEAPLPPQRTFFLILRSTEYAIPGLQHPRQLKALLS